MKPTESPARAASRKRWFARRTPRAFRATYAGTCTACNEGIAIGDIIALRQMHLRCVESSS